MAPLRSWLLLGLSALPAARCGQLDLANWMGQLAPVLGDASILDLSLPGAHDTMTYDLSTTLSEGYEGMGPVISKILHSVTPLLAGEFIRQQGQTQGLKVTDMLESGIRFIDFRIMYTDAPDSLKSHKDWYNLHGCQSEHTALSYLKEIRTWLDAHPNEIVVFWVSRHGDMRLTGTDQYPATTPAERQAFFTAVHDTFGGLMFDVSKGRLNETSVADLWSRGQRVVWYAADYEQSTSSSPLAMDGRLVDNVTPGAGSSFGTLGYFRQGAPHREASKANNHFLLVSMAGGPSPTQIEMAATINFLPLAKHFGAVEKCAKDFGIPNLTNWCPLDLQEYGQLDNFYNQRVLDAIYNEGAGTEAVDFPNAIYINGIDTGGRIRTGTQRLNPLKLDGGSEPSLTDDGHDTDGYAYAATLVGATVRRMCRGTRAQAKGVCEDHSQMSCTEHQIAL
mmetsp:Transcript_58088/g.188027  ORF Transcript_58088/g.188027 Transcript_58088/m.188027 type:complete len:449 (+) Transcript_58088:60-1406(+)|eukprot:CAMPEP_0204152200 /NCGR_PEP_ID=MMETSP0361-20130328/26808_1 /ASSEMBLY_ACC=CAM_ASM_000343 /TAXON_ID=268821 /ORGANISM="Scrippsiella Hangoei, Strain SHTV-5" /LENGTH=448 /DNA_ID=CAMNT_0051107119 /DNA_START=19 /DNA_END=1365 /DNA_ORIENTATION=-